MRCANTEPISVAVVPLPAAAAAAQHGDARELADAAGQHGVREQADARTPRRRAGSAGAAAAIDCLIAVSHASARATTESRLSPIAATTHCQRDGGERVVHDAPVGPAPADQRRPRRASSGNDEQAAASAHFTRPPRRRSPRAAARCRPTRSSPSACARAARPISTRRASSASTSIDRVARARSGSLGRHERAPPPGSRRRRSRGCRRRPPASRTRTPRRARARSSRRRARASPTTFARSSSCVRTSFVTMPSTSMPASSKRMRACSSRYCSGSVPISRSRAPVAGGCRGHARSKHRQPLARVVPADEDDAVVAVGRVGVARG